MKTCVRFDYDGQEYLTCPEVPNVRLADSIKTSMDKYNFVKDGIIKTFDNLPKLQNAEVEMLSLTTMYVKGTFKFASKDFYVDTKEYGLEALTEEEISKISSNTENNDTTEQATEENVELEVDAEESELERVEAEAVQQDTVVIPIVPSTEEKDIEDATVKTLQEVEQEKQEEAEVEIEKEPVPEPEPEITKESIPVVLPKTPNGQPKLEEVADVHPIPQPKSQPFIFGAYGDTGSSVYGAFSLLKEKSRSIKPEPTPETPPNVTPIPVVTKSQKPITKEEDDFDLEPVDETTEEPELGGDEIELEEVGTEVPKFPEEPESKMPTPRSPINRFNNATSKNFVQPTTLEDVRKKEKEEPVKETTNVDDLDEIPAWVQLLPKKVFGIIKAYTTVDIDIDTLLNEGLSYCINNNWDIIDDIAVIDMPKGNVRYIYNSTINEVARLNATKRKEFREKS